MSLVSASLKPGNEVDIVVKRNEMIDRLHDHLDAWDVVIIGGGATGVGIAVDAASRGYRVLLLEQHDFGKGTSSRSTKLIHGGVRYLQQGNISLVLEALHERGILRENAPHLVHDLRFIVPNYDWWEAPFYGVGLKVYDLLAGRYGFGQSGLLSRDTTLKHIPTLKTDGLRGGVQYYDGQFDDSRLLIHLAQTAAEQGAVLINYVRVTGLTKDSGGFVSGIVAENAETGSTYQIKAKVVINATGPFVDTLRKFDNPHETDMIAPSQGIHIVLDKSFLPGDSAIMVPHTTDGRVMFAIPWHGRAVVGTTDTPIDRSSLEPCPQTDEIDFILETASDYLASPPTREDILSVFTGIRPLVKAGPGKTSSLSRDHTIDISKSGLVTICGGKWTTYRRMAKDCIDQAAPVGMLDEKRCVTRNLHLHGYQSDVDVSDPMSVYGSDAALVEQLVQENPEWDQPIDSRLHYRFAEIVWAARHEMARTIEDALCRRTRALFLDAQAAIAAAPKVAACMAAELGKDDAWIAAELKRFHETAKNYLVDTINTSPD